MKAAPVVMCLLLAVAAPAAAQKAESVEGYAEWKRDGVLVVDGQRVHGDTLTVFTGKNIRSIDAIPLGYEVKVKGMRQPDGRLIAQEIEAKPNGKAMFEAQVLSASKEVEDAWVSEGRMFEPKSDGSRENIGPILQSGSDYDRVQRIIRRLVPPYVDASALRVRVVETKAWNASAMGNGAIWVYTGIIHDMTDDELSIVLGHELAHYTHEHSRRNAKQAMFAQMLAAGAQAATAATDNKTAKAVAGLATSLGVSAWMSGYSRDLEDQADRVGLRYAHEAGYDVSVAPGMWARFREKYGEQDKITTFFAGSHSRPTDRIRNVQAEIARNYTAR